MISLRLAKIIDFVTKGFSVVDVGCDHAYLPIELVKTGITPRAIACDINRGPLLAAKKNIKEEKLEDKICTRLSNGLENVKMFEGECLTISGLGGNTIIEILKNGENSAKSFREIILEPQSQYYELRKFLYENDYYLLDEDMVKESGKFYPILKVATYNGLMTKGTNELKIIHKKNPIYELKDLSDTQLEYGPYLLRNKNNTLKEYLIKKRNTLQKVRKHFFMLDSDSTPARQEEVEKEISVIEEVLKEYETK